MEPPTSPSPASKGNSFREAYQLGHLVGRGTFGHVFACRDRATGEDLACKMVLKSSMQCEEDCESLQTEVHLMRLLQDRHPNVVRMRELVENPRAVYLVMEHCRGGDLFELLEAHGRLPEASCKLVFRQLASALSLLHSLDILHRDIKPENVLLDRPAECLYHMTSAEVCDVMRGDAEAPVLAKLADFGLSTVMGPEERLSGMVGSVRFSSPEELRGAEYGTPADVWSLGVVLYAMLSECLPFSGRNPEDTAGLRKAILRGKLKFGDSNWDGVSEEAKDLVRMMLQLDAAKRPTVDEVLQHPWLQGFHELDSEAGDSDSESVMSAPESQLFKPWGQPHLPVGTVSKDEDTGEFYDAFSWLSVVCW